MFQIFLELLGAIHKRLDETLKEILEKQIKLLEMMSVLFLLTHPRGDLVYDWFLKAESPNKNVTRGSIKSANKVKETSV